MADSSKKIAIVIPAWNGQPTAHELEQQAVARLRPRTDYVELVHATGADLIDAYYMAHRATLLASLLSRWVGKQLGQVIEVFLRRKDYDRIVVWSDRLGLMIALLLKLTRSRCRIGMMTCFLSSPRRALFLRLLRPDSHIDTIVCDGSKQLEVLNTQYGIPRHKLHLVLPGVDDEFWQPLNLPIENRICSVGQQDRDYPTLLQAVRGLDVQVDVVLGGVDTSKPELARLVGDDLPPNVVIHTTCSKSELLELYARSMFVVIPTQDVDFAAGSTALKEAMSLGKATIMTKARGQVDYIKHGDNGLTVPPGDPAALREAITHLMHHPEEAERIGRAARKAVKARFTMGIYVERLASLWGGAEATVLDTDQLRTERHIVS